ncbi:MAG: glycosyltransferase family 25 protein [Pyrinomonadaceae bacterium]
MLSPSLRNFYNRVFVVTAQGFDDRQESVRHELGEGDFEFVFGVNKDSTSKEEMIANGVYDETLAIKLDRRNKAMTLGHICCSLGHRNVYRQIVENGIERALIFEDDAVTLPVPESEIEASLQNIPRDAELIYWGWRGTTKPPPHFKLKNWLYKRQHDLGLLKYTHTMIDNLYPTDFNDHFMKAGKTFLTHSYSVTLSAAEKLLKLNTPIVLNADNALMFAVLSGDVRAYISKQQFFGQRSLESDDPISSLTQS